MSTTLSEGDRNGDQGCDRMKKDSEGSKAKLRRHFLANIGRVLSSEELREVAKISEWARRVRELRQLEGFEILTDKDRADLKPGEYLLLNPKPRPVFESSISKETRAFVLDRNGFTCQMCGAAAGDPHPSDASRKVRLHLGHVIDRSKGGSDDASNLRALCSVCNEGAANITLMRPDRVTLLAQIRRATRADQIAVYEWLREKFSSAE
ncbi:MAG: HNH endonuclease [Armatimonadetes bacterium]|nr:HNH endonuclease [Armatimonadota bacterium]